MKRICFCSTITTLAVAWVICSPPNRVAPPDVRAAPSDAAIVAVAPIPPLTVVSAPVRVTATDLVLVSVDSGLRLQESCDDAAAFPPAMVETFFAGAPIAPMMVPQPPALGPARVRVVALPPLNAETAVHLADTLNQQVLRHEHEATHIVVKDAAGNVLASRENPFIAGHSPAPGEAKVLTLYSAYAVDAAGHIASGVNAEAKAAAGAEPIGTIEVSNTCANQNVRVALEGLAAYLDSIN